MITVTKVFHFCYGHRLPDYNGKCRRIHGHNSRVEVEFEEAPNQYPGMCVDFRIIKEIVYGILEELDHNLINDIPDMPQPPTAENMTRWLVDRIFKTKLGPYLVRVRMSETPDSWAEWRRD